MNPPRLGIASLPEYQHHSSATRSSREPGDPPAAHLGRRRASQRESRTGFTPRPSSQLWRGCFSAQGRQTHSSPDRFRHTGFLFQPQQRHAERPDFYQGRDHRRAEGGRQGGRGAGAVPESRTLEATSAASAGQSKRRTLIFGLRLINNKVMLAAQCTLRSGRADNN